MCESAINETIKEEYSNLSVKSTPKDAEKAKLSKILASKYIDLKFFGHVLATGDLPANNLRGALFVGEGESLHPVIVRNIDISRCYATNDKEKTGKKLNQTLGSKAVIDYGMYKIVLKYSPHTGLANGVTSEDLELLIEALYIIYFHRKITPKPSDLKSITQNCPQIISESLNEANYSNVAETNFHK
jgi:Cas7 group CRISPR-associated protein Csh2